MNVYAVLAVLVTHHAGIETSGREGFNHATDDIHTDEHQNGKNCVNVHITSPPIQIQLNPRFLRWLTLARPFWGLPVGTGDYLYYIATV